MAVINRLDPAAVGECLSAWLPRALRGVTDVTVTGVQVSQSTGMSSESVLLDAEWRIDGRREHRGLVARVTPAGGGLFDTYDLVREARVMSALAGATSVPVPRVLAHETDPEVLGAPFMLVERAYGQVPPDDPPYTIAGWVLDLPEERRAALVDGALRVLAGVHT